MSDKNKAIVRRFMEEVMNKKNLAAIDEFISDDMVDHNPAPGTASGLEGVKQTLGMFVSAFPDLRIGVEDLISEGDTVVMRVTTRGTHKGEFMGIAATGKQVEISEIHIVRVAGDKMVEHWGNSDDLGMMQQLGVIPPPA